MATKKYVSLDRLTEYDKLIKAEIAEGDDSVKSYVNTELAKKADKSHNHDDLYYTEAEIDTKLEGINTSISNITSGSTKVQDAVHADSSTSADEATHAATAETANEATHAVSADEAKRITGLTGGENQIVSFDENGNLIAQDHESGMVLKNFITTMPSSAMWSSIAYNGNVYIAIAYNTNIAARSYDGMTWETISMPSTAQWYDIVYGNGIFVTVAGRVAYYSADEGTTWNVCSGIEYTCTSIIYGNGMFVAIGSKDNALYSADGITWQSTTIPNCLGWNSVAYGNGKFVAVGNAYGDTVSAYSIDGINWTSARLSTAKNWGAVTYANGKFVAISSGTFQCQVAVSIDGIDWTVYNRPSNNQWDNITYGAGKFVTIGLNGIYAYSVDGATWTESIISTANMWKAIIYADNKFTAIDYNGSAVTYSYDGITWLNSCQMISQDGVDITADTVAALALDLKADVTHNHDDIYDAKGAAATAEANAKEYADVAAAVVKNDLLNGAGEAYDTLKELGDLISENVDAIDALKTVATGKADREHTHAFDEITDFEVITMDEIDEICGFVTEGALLETDVDELMAQLED